MREFFLTIIGTILVLNVMFLLLPHGKYEKYVKYVAGVIVLLTIATNLFSVKIDHDIINFDNESAYYNNEDLNIKVKEQISESTLKEKILNETGIEVDIDLSLNNEKIDKITIENAKEKEDKIINIIMSECDINRDKIVIK